MIPFLKPTDKIRQDAAMRLKLYAESRGWLRDDAPEKPFFASIIKYFGSNQALSRIRNACNFCKILGGAPPEFEVWISGELTALDAELSKYEKRNPKYE